MAEARRVVAQDNLLDLPQMIVHGDFASWNLLFTDNKLTGVMAELWSGARTGRFDLSMDERQLGLTGTVKP